MATPPPSAAVMALPQVSIQIDVFIDPSNVEKFLEAFKQVFDLVAVEPELLYFDMFQDPDDVGHLSWVENWNKDAEWLMTVRLFLFFVRCFFAFLMRDFECGFLKQIGRG
jgi:hypothetical protein